jgi:hypothetical protein
MEEITLVLYEASQQRRMCRIQMSGEPLSRVIHPYGICKTSGNKIMLVGWQSLGFTNTKGQPGYRNLALADCESVEMMDSYFTVEKNFNPADSQYKEWVYHI